MKKSVLLSSLALFLSTSLLPGLCANNLKIGATSYKPSAPLILNKTGDSGTVSFAGHKGRRVGTANFIFQKLIGQITQGAEFDVVTGANGQDGKVLITFSDQNISGRGKTTTIASDDQSTATGKIKIVSVSSDGNFTFTVNAQISNALKRVSNPLSGNFNGTDSRNKGIVKVTGSFTTVSTP